jgi:transposase
MNRKELTDQQWERLQPLLPPRAKRGRPRQPDRQILSGILWVLRTGAPWRDVPERYGKPMTIYHRYWQWRKEGHWDVIFAAVQQHADAQGGLDWSIHYVDGTVVRAHQHAAGGKRGTPARKPWAGAAAVCPPKCTCVRKAMAN